MSDQRFNTGNPIGSDSPLDRSDNTRNLDVLENSRELTEFPDRFGVPRQTRYGMETAFDSAQGERANQFAADQAWRDSEFNAAQTNRADQFNSFLSASGYQPLGEYAPGIEITAHNQYVEHAGQPYSLKPSVPVPYTTSGEWDGEDFVLIGDNALRQDLANPDKGAAMVARGVVAVDSIADLLALPPGQKKAGLRYLVASYYGGWAVESPYRGPSGGGVFHYDPARVSENDGGTVLNGFVRHGIRTVCIDAFGVSESRSSTDNVPSLRKAFESGVKRLRGAPGAEYPMHVGIKINNGIEFDGRGCVFKFQESSPMHAIAIDVLQSSRVRDLILDFGGGNAGTAIRYPLSNSGVFGLKNILIRNVDDKGEGYTTDLIDINHGGNKVELEGIKFENIIKRHDTAGGESVGGMHGLLIRTYAAADVGGGGYVRKVRVSNFRTLNSSGALVNRMANAIYLVFSGTDRRANITLHDIKGTNFGRRLIKLQCSNVSISKVRGHAENDSICLAGISILDITTGTPCRNVRVKDAKLTGAMRHGIATEIDDVELKDIVTDVTMVGVSPNFYGSAPAMGVAVAGNETKLTGASTIRADHCYVLYRPAEKGKAHGLVVKGAILKPAKAGGKTLNLGDGADGSAGISLMDSLELSDVTLDNSEFPADGTIGWAAQTAAENGLLKIKNLTVIDDDGGAPGGSNLVVRGFKNVIVDGFAHTNKSQEGFLYRPIQIFNSTRVDLSDINIPSRPQFTGVWVANVDHLTVDGLEVSQLSAYNITLSNVQRSRLIGLDPSRINFTSDVSRIGCGIGSIFSSGATAQRPTIGLFTGRTYFDTTIGKSIWWDATASIWRDAMGGSV